MHPPDIVVDTVLLFATRKVYTLNAGLELLNVLPRACTPVTHCYILRRLAPAAALGTLGRLDLIQKINHPLSPQSMRTIVIAAADASHLHILDWVRRDCHVFDYTYDEYNETLLHEVFGLATECAHFLVMEWCVANGLDLPDCLDQFFYQATSASQILSLGWLKAYALEHGLPYAFESLSNQDFPLDRSFAALNWWKKEHAEQQLPPLFQIDAVSFINLAYSAGHGCAIVDWCQQYSAEVGMAFEWPVLDAERFYHLYFADLEYAKWWWKHTVQQIGLDAAVQLLEDNLGEIRNGFSTSTLDWYWDLTQDLTSGIVFQQNWRPTRPFRCLSSFRWWAAKVESGEVDAAVLESTFQHQRKMFSFARQYATTDLDWLWARRDSFAYKNPIFSGLFSQLVNHERLDLMPWFFDHCPHATLPLPVLRLNQYARLVSLGRMDIVEQILRLAQEAGETLRLARPGCKRINHHHFAELPMLPELFLDYLLDFCDRIGVPFAPASDSKMRC